MKNRSDLALGLYAPHLSRPFFSLPSAALIAALRAQRITGEGYRRHRPSPRAKTVHAELGDAYTESDRFHIQRAIDKRRRRAARNIAQLREANPC